MKISELRKDFLVYVVDDEESICSTLKQNLSDAGYTVKTFSTAEDVLKKIKSSPPHIILSDLHMSGQSGLELLSKVSEASDEIQFLIMISHANLETGLKSINMGAYDYVYKPFEELEDVVRKVDKAAEKLYLQYENEQLHVELKKKNKKMNQSSTKEEKKDIQKLTTLIEGIEKAKTLKETVQIYLNQVSELMGGSPVIFLRYMPSYMALSAIQSSQYPMEKLRQVGIRLDDIEASNLIDMLRKPNKMQKLKALVNTVFKEDKFIAMPLEVKEGFVGITLVLKPANKSADSKALNSFNKFFSISYDNISLQKKIHDMSIKDALTGLLNRDCIHQKITEEISRARRTKMPVSLIYLDVDHFKSYNDQNGRPMGDQLLRMIATILVKTSRINDIVARMEGQEFVLLLPHTSLKGAALKAERLRRTIEEAGLPYGEQQPLGKVTISVGVSEYPSVSESGESLLKSADDSLYQAKSTSKNCVSVASVPEGFKPDFVPIEVIGIESDKVKEGV